MLQDMPVKVVHEDFREVKRRVMLQVGTQIDLIEINEVYLKVLSIKQKMAVLIEVKDKILLAVAQEKVKLFEKLMVVRELIRVDIPLGPETVKSIIVGNTFHLID